ncbi:MAG: hypothetical protein RR505_13440, partial [Raoultibacter sp.]
MSNEEMQRSDLHAIRFYLYQVFHSCFAIKPCESQFECLKNSETIEILGLFSRSQTYLDAVAGFVESVGKIDYNEAAAEFSRLFEQPGRPPVPFW